MLYYFLLALLNHENLYESFKNFFKYFLVNFTIYKLNIFICILINYDSITVGSQKP